jgi:hypothetical protein
VCDGPGLPGIEQEIFASYLRPLLLTLIAPREGNPPDLQLTNDTLKPFATTASVRQRDQNLLCQE